ncbi:hypothetical protein MUN88_19960 [Gracilibacillus caseinilyticus]|uniref:DUF4129 domain-containing protein n=1 Tax=Gracilibacillus caseinilyticus TaxID=2932256 RepID=A0ABY4EXC1_9BACI|nr:hypothetical protein [Gracilibacillus caseinilyticus]UOQ48284.1 hypothetical protein MUN88_19960 [Gracilibacillus caseinilyticus]
MPAKTKQFPSVLFHGLIEWIGFFPIFLVVGVWLFDSPYLYYWVVSLLLLFSLGYLFRCFISNRWLAIGLSTLLTVGITYVIALTIWAMIVGLLLGFFVSFRGVQHAENDWEDLFPSRLLWSICLPLYFVAYLYFRYNDSVAGFDWMISYLGLVLIVLMLFLTNREHIERESLEKGKKKKVAADISRLNKGYLIVTLVVVFLITNFGMIQSALFNGIRSLIQSIIWLVSLGNDEEEIKQEQPPADMTPSLPGAEQQETSAFAEWMDRMMHLVSYALMAVLLILFIALLFNKTRRLLIKAVVQLWKMMQQMFSRRQYQETSTDFHDEKESLFDWQQWRKQSQQKINETWQNITNRKPKFENMTNEQKVRFLYKKASANIRRQDKWHAALTAHEVIALNEQHQTLAVLESWYDDIRYGNFSINEQHERQLWQLWEKMQQNGM